MQSSLSSSLFIHSPTIQSSNLQISSANHSKFLRASAENFNTPFSFQHHRLPIFLHNCKTGNITPTQALRFFHLMLHSNPTLPISSFNDQLLGGLTKIKHYFLVLSLFHKMHLPGLSPDCCTLNILINCLCNVNWVSQGLAAMVGIWGEVTFLIQSHIIPWLRIRL